MEAAWEKVQGRNFALTSRTYQLPSTQLPFLCTWSLHGRKLQGSNLSSVKKTSGEWCNEETTFLPTHQDGVPLHRHEVQRRGTSQAGALVFTEAPRPVVLGQHQTVVVQCGNADADIVEGTEAERLFNNHGVRLLSFFRIVLHEEAVALVLEVAVDLTFSDVLQLRDGTRETDVVRVGAVHAPLSEQVACIAAFLTGSGQ